VIKKVIGDKKPQGSVIESDNAAEPYGFLSPPARFNQIR
jgi:hypothetical protein